MKLGGGETQAFPQQPCVPWLGEPARHSGWLRVSSTTATGKAGAWHGRRNHGPRWTPGQQGAPAAGSRRRAGPRHGDMAAALRGPVAPPAPVAMATPRTEGRASLRTHAPQPPCPRDAGPANCPDSNSHPRRPIAAGGAGRAPPPLGPSGQSPRLLCLKKKCARPAGVAQARWANGRREAGLREAGPGRSSPPALSLTLAEHRGGRGCGRGACPPAGAPPRRWPVRPRPLAAPQSVPVWARRPVRSARSPGTCRDEGRR